MPNTNERFFRNADGGIPTGGFAAFQAALLRNDPPDRPFRLRRRSGSNPFMYTKTEYLSVPCFRVRRRRDSNPRAPEGKRISSAPRYDHFDTSALRRLLQFFPHMQAKTPRPTVKNYNITPKC